MIGDVPEGDTLLYFFIYSEKRVSPQGTSPYYYSLRSPAAVPLHPEPMKEGERVLARMEGNRRYNRYHLHNYLSQK